MAARRANRGQRFPPQPLTGLELEQLLGTCTRSATGLRNAALITTLYRSGIRISEALDLRPSDVDRDERLLWIGHGKGAKQRTAAIDNEALTPIDLWLDARRKLGVPAPGYRPLFCTLQGRQLSTGYARHICRAWRARPGSRRVHAHALRHTHANELAMEGTPTLPIKQQLGHSNISTTSAYLDHIAHRDVAAAIRDRPPWDRAA